MKSIREKSLEVFPEHCNYFTSSDNERKRIGFVAGANYVLDEIEEFQKLFSTCMNSHANGYLKSVIEQLKK